MSSESEPTSIDNLSNEEKETTAFGNGKSGGDSEQIDPFPEKSNKGLGASPTTLVQESSESNDQVQDLDPQITAASTSTSLDDSESVVTNNEVQNSLIEDDEEEPMDDSDDDFPQFEDVPRGPLKGQVSGQKPKPKPK
ncbi:hypothetical protein GALMADRAFT_242347 [Galerina marginata CBS 339.88]|uniref:Uncharacterized protein n=1 Tax=Galerina marginata (strain CBS 339.88) TaxID=685588 RepID=A0A067TJL5_GALM3|nr:hypothetical protein GALMADRAFT_242347 [Galerina marginata CBS 339.88]